MQCGKKEKWPSQGLINHQKAAVDKPLPLITQYKYQEGRV